MARGETKDKVAAQALVDRILESDPDNDFAYGLVKLRPEKRGLQKQSGDGFVWPSATNVFASTVIVVALLVINTVIIQSTFLLLASIGAVMLLVTSAVFHGFRKKADPKQLR